MNKRLAPFLFYLLSYSPIASAFLVLLVLFFYTCFSLWCLEKWRESKFHSTVKANTRNYPEKEDRLWGVYMKDIPKFSLSFFFSPCQSPVVFIRRDHQVQKEPPPHPLPPSTLYRPLVVSYSYSIAPPQHLSHLFFRAYRINSSNDNNSLRLQQSFTARNFYMWCACEKEKKKRHFFVFVYSHHFSKKKYTRIRH